MNNNFEHLQELLKIKDDETRKQAVLDFYNSLSEQEREEINSIITSTLERVLEVFQSFADAAGEVVTQAFNHLQKWFEENPEIQTYIEQMEKVDVD